VEKQRKNEEAKMKTTLKLAMVITALVLIISPLIYVSVANQLENGSHGIELLKSADPFAYIGDNVTYRIQVYTPSDYDLYNLNVTDTMLEFEDIIPYIARAPANQNARYFDACLRVFKFFLT
jgi:hypothetical protein